MQSLRNPDSKRTYLFEEKQIEFPNQSSKTTNWNLEQLIVIFTTALHRISFKTLEI